jgi:hypothetical protein
MRPPLYLALSLVMAACGGAGAKTDLEHVRTVRSLLAEWQLVAEMHPADTYTRQMRAEAARQLAAAAASARRSGSPAGAAIADIADVPADASPASIRERAAAAGRLEGRLATR